MKKAVQSKPATAVAPVETTHSPQRKKEKEPSSNDAHKQADGPAEPTPVAETKEQTHAEQEGSQPVQEEKQEK